MTDLTPDEVMAKHREIKPEDDFHSSWCVTCRYIFPCEVYKFAERAKTAEARVEALEAVVRVVAYNKAVLVSDENGECLMCGTVDGHHRDCAVARAVELMEGDK